MAIKATVAAQTNSRSFSVSFALPKVVLGSLGTDTRKQMKFLALHGFVLISNATLLLRSKPEFRLYFTKAVGLRPSGELSI